MASSSRILLPRHTLTRIGLALLVLTLAALLTGCGNDPTIPASATNAGSAKHYRILAVIKTLSNSYWQTMQKGYQDAGRDLNVGVDIITINTEQDADQQAQLLDSALAKNYDAILVSPVTPTNLLPPLAKASAKGTPIILVDEGVDREAAHSAKVKISTFIASDNRHAGQLAAQWVIDNLGKGGPVALVEGKAGNPSNTDRSDGFSTTLAKDSRFKLVARQNADWDRVLAAKAAGQILQSNPDLIAFYAANDTMALGVMDAVKTAGKTGQIAIIGTDAIADARTAIKSGEMTGTVAQFPDEEAHIAVESAVKVLEQRPVNDFVPSPIKLLTKNDVP